MEIGGELMQVMQCPSMDEPEYDLFLSIPDCLTEEDAFDIVQAAIKKIKDANPREWNKKDLLEELESHGITKMEVLEGPMWDGNRTDA